jgi:hypothetical protein
VEYYLKLKRNERVGGVPQVVKHLPSKHEALSSNPVLQKQKTKSKKYYCV